MNGNGKYAKIFASVATVGVAVVTLITSFELVDWTAAQATLVSAEFGAIVALIAAVFAHRDANTNAEPAAVAGAFTAAVAATLALGSGFGWWTLSAAQTSALVGMVTAVISLLGAWFVRDRVAPTT